MVGEQSSQSSIDMEWEFEGITDSQMNNFETEGRIGRARSASPSLRAPRALSQVRDPFKLVWRLDINVNAAFVVF